MVHSHHGLKFISPWGSILIRFFLIIFLSYSSLVIADQSDLVIYNKGDVFDDFTVGMYEDSSASLSFKQIQNIENFIPQSNRISEGYSNSFFWYKFKITNATQSEVTYFVQFTENFVHELDGYIVSRNGQYIKQEQGVGYFSTNGVNELKKPRFKIDIASGETKTIYLRMFGIYPNMNSFIVMDEKSVNNYNLKYDTLYSIFVGSALSLLLYNLAIYLFSRQTAYLYYVFYVSTFLAWQLLNIGFFPFNSFNNISSFYLSGISIPLLVASGVFFCRTILDTNLLFPKIDKTLKGIGYFYLVLAVSFIFFMAPSIIVINAVATFVLPFMLYAGFKCYLAGNKTALFYVIAQLSFLSTSTLFSLMTEGYLEYNLLTRHGLTVGFIIEITLFSLALAYKIRILEQEKFDLINQINVELDEKVRIRTKELEKSREELKELASRDSLTNLYNRRSLFEIGEQLIGIAKRQKSPLSIIMFDIDKFKSVNDTYGHSVGDDVIKLFAKLLQQTRKGDIAARIGGEEFVLLLPNTDKNGAYEIASKIREEVEKMKVVVENNTALVFTISGGVCPLFLEDEADINQALQRADKALYRAKDSGRNRIILSA